MGKRLIDLYPYRTSPSGPEFLLLKRAKGKIYEGQWRMVGGKAEEGETFWQAALRELKEETGLNPKSFWTLPSINTFYEYTSDMIHQVPAFAAELDPSSNPELDDEHLTFGWFEADKAVQLIHWPEQKRLIQLADHILKHDQILEEWLVPLQ
ncbi:MAG: NUDIX pyrophosphatase [Balneolaceae bacterium]|nr:NUDIX pyrophosphatase [Balneolaceae bacterium]